MDMLDTLYVKVEGLWHQANEGLTVTLCGLDPQDVDDAREGYIPTDAPRCRVCFDKAPQD